MTLTFQHLTGVLLLIYCSLFLSGIYYCLRVFCCAAVRMSELELEQGMNIKFLVKLGKSGNEIREKLVQVYRDNAMYWTAWLWRWRHYELLKHWELNMFHTHALNYNNAMKKFTSGWKFFLREERSGRPATSRTEENVAKIRQIVRENLRMTVRSIAEQVDIDRETVRKITARKKGQNSSGSWRKIGT